jgi:hypothetical protein
MKTYLEQELSKDALQFWDETLEAQVNFSGRVELPYLIDRIRRSRPGRVADVGTGREGAFALRSQLRLFSLHCEYSNRRFAASIEFS